MYIDQNKKNFNFIYNNNLGIIKEKEVIIMKRLLILLSLSTWLFAENLSFETLNSGTMHISIKNENKIIFKEFKNKKVILDFFGTTCPVCTGVTEKLKSLQRGNRDNLIVIGLQVQNDISDNELREFVLKHKINYYVINMKEAKKIKLYLTSLNWKGAIPFAAIFNKKGELINTSYGYEIKNLLDELQ
jgi:thiol-disulfide isomerase/thioredoxin